MSQKCANDNSTIAIDGLQFSVLGPDEIRSMSVVEVNEPQQFENGRPVAHGPFDLRMGSITRALDCATCHRNKEQCPGHMGHIELQVPVPHPFFADAIKQVVNCVCYRCSELLVVKDEAFLRAMRAKLNPKARATMLYNQMAKKPVRVCGYCGWSKPVNKKLAALNPLVSGSGKFVAVSSQQAKKVRFLIGRGEKRLDKYRPTTRPSEPRVEGSGSVFGETFCSLEIEPQVKPTLEQVKNSAMAQLAKKTDSDNADNSIVHSHDGTDGHSTIDSACFHIQPRITYENTNFYMQWPDSTALYSFLMRGSAENDYVVEGETEADELDEQDSQRGDEDDNDGPEDEDDMQTDVSLKRKRKSGKLAVAKKRAKIAAKKPRKRKKIKDATAADVRRLLSKSAFKLLSTAQPGSRELMSSKQIYDILCRISAENCYLLGFDPLYSHPSWFMITVLPVPPPCIRPLPDISRNNSKHLPLDDISFKLIQLIKKNNDLAKQRNYRDANFNNYQLLVKHHVMTLIDNKLRGQSVARRTPKGPPLESLSCNLKGKHGRVRGSMLGKRVDFSSRAVVGCDGTLRSDQVGVPAEIARTLTVPEYVNRFNIERLQRAVDAGPSAHREGANYVHTADGTRCDLRVRSRVTLREGFTVERHMRKDDVVILNRQPSLHRMSMMGHRVVVHDGDNFRFNLAVTTPYNADFDGDEVSAALLFDVF